MNVLSFLFYFLVGAGFLGAVVWLGVVVVDGLRRRDPDRVTSAFPWGYMGVGLFVGIVGFLTAEVMSTQSWPRIADALGAVLVLIVASAGYAGWVELAGMRFKKSVPWTIPLLLSLTAGVLASLANVPL